MNDEERCELFGLEKVAKDIKLMTWTEVDDAFSEIDTQQLPEVNKIATDICHCRAETSMLGIDYCRINNEDFKRAQIAAWRLIRKGDEE